MRHDVEQWLSRRRGGKLSSKETLNHAELVSFVSGLDVFSQTPEAFLRAYEALGIDIVNRVPLEPAPPPTPEGRITQHASLPYTLTHLGIYDTATRNCFLDEDLLWSVKPTDFNHDELILPAPHPFDADDAFSRQTALGDVGLYYPMLYTTLFMWAVEMLGWETFLVNAFEEPDRFHDRFLVPGAARSLAMIERYLDVSGAGVLFLHDDLASANGPIISPVWYEEFIYPHFQTFLDAAKVRGAKVILVADGDMTTFLPRLLELGFDGLMFENPATPIEAVAEYFGSEGQFLIGGIDTGLLQMGSPSEVARMVEQCASVLSECPGWAISSCGGLHDGIPMENLTAYFDARVAIGATPADWRTRMRVTP